MDPFISVVHPFPREILSLGDTNMEPWVVISWFEMYWVNTGNELQKYHGHILDDNTANNVISFGVVLLI